MPCTKCKSDFNFFNWKIKCVDCELHHCSRCLKKSHGSVYCDKCYILNKRPPDREKLMELKSKDLRDYLNKNNVSTHGLVEKAELVDMFHRIAIPPRTKRGGAARFGSVPDLSSRSHEQISNIRSNINSNLNNIRSQAEHAIYNLGRRVGPSGSNGSSGGSSAGNYSSNSSPRMPTYQDSGYSNPQFQTSYVHSFNISNGPTETSTGFVHQNAQQTNEEAPETQESAPAEAAPRYPKLSDFETAEELAELSVKQLKELLTLNRVDYKGCVEKNELLDRATRLWHDNNQHKNDDFENAEVDNLCKICMDAPLDCVILECGHMATCVNCGKRLAECPICRQYVTRVVRTFKV